MPSRNKDSPKVNLTDKFSDLDDLNRFERFLCEADLKNKLTINANENEIFFSNGADDGRNDIHIM